MNGAIAFHWYELALMGAGLLVMYEWAAWRLKLRDWRKHRAARRHFKKLEGWRSDLDG